MAFAGKPIYYSYLYGNKHTEWPPGTSDDPVFSPAKVTVSDAVEIGGDTSLYSVDISDTQVRFEFHDIGVFTGSGFSGTLIEDRDDVVEPIVGFKLQTNMSGLTKDDISIQDGDQIFINWQSTSITSHTYIQLTLQFGPYRVAGGVGNDVLHGTAHDEQIVGGRGRDRLYGGGGKDTFVFAAGDTGKTNAKVDTIFDFNARVGETVDLSHWDANSKKSGLQDFDFIGHDAFSGHAGELRFATLGRDTRIFGDTDGDVKADFSIQLDDPIRLTRDQFVF